MKSIKALKKRQRDEGLLPASSGGRRVSVARSTLVLLLHGRASKQHAATGRRQRAAGSSSSAKIVEKGGSLIKRANPRRSIIGRLQMEGDIRFGEMLMACIMMRPRRNGWPGIKESPSCASCQCCPKPWRHGVGAFRSLEAPIGQRVVIIGENSIASARNLKRSVGIFCDRLGASLMAAQASARASSTQH